VVESRRLSGADLVVHFMGVDEAQIGPLTQMALKEGIEVFFNCQSRRPRSEASALLDRSTILVVLPQIHIHSIPAKVFEYVQRRAWILVLSEPETAVAELLQDTRADVLSPESVEGIAEAIGHHFDDWRQGIRPVPLNADGTFSRGRQAELFFRELDLAIGRADASGEGRLVSDARPS
jgi:hypothetical protein